MQFHPQTYSSLASTARVLVINSHTPCLQRRYVYVDGIPAQRIVAQPHCVSLSQSGVVHQGGNVAYLVSVKVEACQAGEAGQGGDVAYLVARKVEPCQAGEADQG